MGSLTVEHLMRMGRVKRVASMMMLDRGYQLSGEEQALESMPDLAVAAKYVELATRSACSLARAMSCTYAAHAGGERALVLFLDPNYDDVKKREKMVSCDQAKAAVQLWDDTFADCRVCIIVAPGKMSPDARKELARESLRVLRHDFLLFPVGRHAMVPPHYRLSPEERAAFLRARQLEAAQLPQLKAQDPVAMYYGYEPGAVVRISRPGWTVFRVVA